MISSEPVLEEQLAKLEPLYKSRGEAQIGRLLDRYGIAGLLASLRPPAKIARYLQKNSLCFL